MPTFTYSFCWNKVYDKKASISECGLLAELMWNDHEAIRSDDANFSIVAIGALAEYFTEYSPKHSFGPDSFWERFLEKKGKFVNLNFDAASTFIHYVEKKIQVPYRYDKKFTGISIIDGKEVEREFVHYVYDLEKPNHEPAFAKFHKRAEELGLVKKVNLGRGQIVSITAQETYDLIEKELKTNPSFLIVGQL
jgi:aminoglycoside 3-N-acetyltransferase